jgi:hypothetical protein
MIFFLPQVHMIHTHVWIYGAFHLVKSLPPPPVEPPTIEKGDVLLFYIFYTFHRFQHHNQLRSNIGAIMSHLPVHTSEDPLFSYIFQSDEDILEAMTTPDCPWDAMHHRSFFLSQEAFQPSIDTHVYVIETKDFIPPGHVDWFKNPIPTLDAFEEGNMANISPTIKIDIFVKPDIVEEITLVLHAPLKKFTTYKSLFQEFRDIFSWSYTKIPRLDPTIVEHRIDTWPDVSLVHQNK